jgi:hypothetical protein
MRRLIVLVALAILAVMGQQAQADLVIAGWTFETTPPTSEGPLTADVGIGQATSNTGGTFSNPAGYGSAESWSSNGWNVNEYFQFSVSTLGRSDIRIDWAQTGSGTGPRDFQLQYQVNGSGFTNLLDYSLIASNWNGTINTGHDFGFNLSAIAAVNNAATVDFRMAMRNTTSINGGTVAAGGTGRIDNVFIRGVPEPSALLLLGACVAPLALGRRRPLTVV